MFSIYPEERYKSAEEENGAHREEDAERRQNKIPQSCHIPHAHRANTAQHVAYINNNSISTYPRQHLSRQLACTVLNNQHQSNS